MKENPCNGLQSLSKSVLSSLSSLTFTVFLTHSVPSTQMALLFLELPRHSPTLGSPHLLFPQPAKARPIYSYDLFTFFSSFFNCHIFSEALFNLYTWYYKNLLPGQHSLSSLCNSCYKKKKKICEMPICHTTFDIYLSLSPFSEIKTFWGKEILPILLTVYLQYLKQCFSYIKHSLKICWLYEITD